MGEIKTLPPGYFVRFENIKESVSEEDIQRLFLERTGVEIPLDRIGLGEAGPRNRYCAMISLGSEHLRPILQWAFDEDELDGCRIRVANVSRSTTGHERR